MLSEDAIAMMRQEQSEATTGITSDTPYTFLPFGRIRCSTGGACTAIRERMKALFVIYMSNL
ncbi:MAG: hypothetical protein V8Q88_05685 [Christensenellales bacterium]